MIAFIDQLLFRYLYLSICFTTFEHQSLSEKNKHSFISCSLLTIVEIKQLIEKLIFYFSTVLFNLKTVSIGLIKYE